MTLVTKGPMGAGVLGPVVDASPDAVLAVSVDRRVLAVNRRFLELWNLGPGEVVVGGPSPALGDSQRRQIVDPVAFEAAIAYGHAHPSEVQTVEVQLVDGRVIEGYSAPINDATGAYLGRAWFQRDVTDRHEREAERAAMMEQVAAVERAHQFLLRAAQTVMGVSGYAATLQSLAEISVPTLGDLCLIDVAQGSGEIVRVAVHHADEQLSDPVARLFSWAPDPQGEHPSAQVIRDGVSRWSEEMGDQFLRATTRSSEHLKVLKSLKFTSYLCVPLLGEGKVLGAMTLVSTGEGRRLHHEDVKLAEALAGHIALVVVKERRYDQERLLSHQLQVNLLSTDIPPQLGLDVAVRYLPGSGGAEVGGDFWDIAKMRNGEAAFVIGDVFGHDMVAAATMAQLRSVCRILRAQTENSAELIALVQDNWEHLDLERLATAAFVRIDPSTRRMRIASAGHFPPLVVEPGNAFFVPVTPGPPLGAGHGPAPIWEGALVAEARLILFTDGLVERRHSTLDDGLARLLDAACRARHLDVDGLADHILTSMRADEGDDDVALVVIRPSTTALGPC